LYDYYKSVLSSDIIDIFIIGNINPEKIQELFLEMFPVKTLKKPAMSHYLEPLTPRRIMKTVKEQKDINQSHLLVGCKIDALTEMEKKYVMNVYNFILGGSSDSKLFQNVREKNSLCYSIHSTYQPTANLLIIKAGIDATSYKKAVSLIKKEISNISKGNFEESDIEKAKITYLSAFNELEDSPNSIISTYISHEYLDYDDLEERKKKIKDVTKDMVIEVAKKVHADTIYLLEGGKNYETDENE
ncbi:MAG: insulinase family protein, partial [Clostridia bacterium]|nr:insulinase family protein [Clostridia bacterium]